MLQLSFDICSPNFWLVKVSPPLPGCWEMQSIKAVKAIPFILDFRCLLNPTPFQSMLPGIFSPPVSGFLLAAATLQISLANIQRPQLAPTAFMQSLRFCVPGPSSDFAVRSAPHRSQHLKLFILSDPAPILVYSLSSAQQCDLLELAFIEVELVHRSLSIMVVSAKMSQTPVIITSFWPMNSSMPGMNLTAYFVSMQVRSLASVSVMLIVSFYFEKSTWLKMFSIARGNMPNQGIISPVFTESIEPFGPNIVCVLPLPVCP